MRCSLNIIMPYNRFLMPFGGFSLSLFTLWSQVPPLLPVSQVVGEACDRTSFIAYTFQGRISMASRRLFC